MADEEVEVVVEEQVPAGTVSIAVTRVSLNTLSMGDDCGGSVSVWARVVSKRSDSAWVAQSSFAKAVGWTAPPAAEGDEAAAEASGPFSFWPPTCKDGSEVDTEDAAWTRSNVCKLRPDAVKKALAEIVDDMPEESVAAAAWEELLGAGDTEDVSAVDIDYPPHESGFVPTRSGPIPCNVNNIAALLNTELVVELYKGDARDPTVDQLVGMAPVGAVTWTGRELTGTETSMQRVLQYPGGVECSIPIVMQPTEEGTTVFASPPSVTVAMVADDTLLKFCRGGRTFSAVTSGVYLNDADGKRADHIATAWGLDGDSWEGASFSMSCAAPGGSVTTSLPNGKLQKATPPAEADVGEDGAPATVAADEAADLTWAPADSPCTLMTAFLPATAVADILSAETAPMWEVSVSKERPEDAEEEAWAAEPGVNMVTYVEIGILREPGLSKYGGKFALTDKRPKDPPPNTEEMDTDDETEAMEKYNAPLPTPLLFLYVQFDEPLVALPPPPPEPVLTPKDIVPPRENPEAKPGKMAGEIFREEVSSVVATLTEEISRLFGTRPSENTGSSREERRRQLLYQLNTGGKYHEFRQRLKRSVARLVKERFPSKSTLSAGTLEHDKFMTDLYSHLMGEVMKVVNTAFQDAEGVPVDLIADPEALPESEREIVGAGGDTAVVLKRLASLALEAELNGDIVRAGKCHQDCVTASEEAAKRRYVRAVPGGGAEPWLTYASFCSRTGDISRAKECCREAVSLSLQPTNGDSAVPVRSALALCLHGAILAEEGEWKDASVMFAGVLGEEAQATQLEMENACTLAALTYNSMKQFRKAEKAMLQATADGKSEIDLYHQAVAFLMRHGLSKQAPLAMQMAAAAGTDGGLEEGITGLSDTIAWTAMKMDRQQRVRHMWLAGFTSMVSNDVQGAQKNLKAAIELEEKCHEAWCLLGHLMHSAGNAVEAKRAYQTALPLLEAQSTVEPIALMTGLPLLYIRLGALYLDSASDAGAAKEVFLRCCRSNPSASVWLGVGRACIMLGLLNEAEEALAEANIIDNRNPTVWGYLALMCATIEPRRNQESDQCMRQAIKLNLMDSELLARIGNAYKVDGRFDMAEAALRRALAATGTKDQKIRLALAEVLQSQNKYEVAIKEYRTVLRGDSSAANKKVAAIGVKTLEAALGGSDTIQ